MKHFKLVGEGIDISPYLDEIEGNAELWAIDTSRQDNIVKQRETQAMTLRAHAAQAIDDSRARATMPFQYRGRSSEMSVHFPLASAFVDEWTKKEKGVNGRSVIVRLKPQGTIYPHSDDGLYWCLRDRYHLVVKSANGSLFKAGGEEVRMGEGELWWFDPTVEHEAFNDSDEDRIHIIFDVLSVHSLGSFATRFMRAPLRSLRALGGGVTKTIVGLARPQKPVALPID
jgi:quercetin dioxygenase-like cupin family protein